MELARRRFLQTVPGGCLAAIASRDALAQPPDRLSNDPNALEPLETESDWRRVRALFPMADDLTYFNAGGLGPAPAVVIRAVCDTVHALQEHTRHGHELIEKARPIVAKFAGADPSEIAFTRNATEGNSTIAAGLQLEAGDEVIIDSHAHQGGSVAWMARRKYERIKLLAFEPDHARAAGNVERIERLLTPQTRVIQVSHITAPTGLRMPIHQIAALARAKDIWFHVDGAQSLGMFPFQVSSLGCDSYATSGHKWMCGPTGTGILFVRRDRLDAVQPTDVGSYGNAAWRVPAELEFVDSARRFECGTRDAATVVGLAEAVKLLDSIGLDRIWDRGRQLASHLRMRPAGICER